VLGSLTQQEDTAAKGKKKKAKEGETEEGAEQEEEAAEAKPIQTLESLEAQMPSEEMLEEVELQQDIRDLTNHLRK